MAPNRVEGTCEQCGHKVERKETIIEEKVPRLKDDSKEPYHLNVYESNQEQKVFFERELCIFEFQWDPRSISSASDAAAALTQYQAWVERQPWWSDAAIVKKFHFMTVVGYVIE